MLIFSVACDLELLDKKEKKNRNGGATSKITDSLYSSTRSEEVPLLNEVTVCGLKIMLSPVRTE